MRGRVRSIVATVSLAAVLAGAPAAMAGDTPCVGILTGEFDNVVVPANATCDLQNSIVHGSVKALEDSTLIASGNIVAGNIKGDKAGTVQLSGNFVGGSISLKEGGLLGATGNTVGGNIEGDKADTVEVIDNTVGGDISVKEGDLLVAGRNAVGGDIEGDKADTVEVIDNTVGGDISIKKGLEAGVSGNFLFTGNISVEKIMGSVFVEANTVRRGNIQVQENVIPAGSVLEVAANTVAEDLQVFKKTGPGTKQVTGNTVLENLQCKENDPPFVGSPNAAAKAEDQCF